MQKNILQAIFCFSALFLSSWAHAFSWQSLFGLGKARNNKIEEIKKVVAHHEAWLLKKFLAKQKNEDATSFQEILEITYFEAIKSGDTNLVEAVLDCGADINALQKGQTALHIAAQEDNLQMVSFLTKKGIRYKTNSRGKTPAEIAAASQKKNTEKILRVLCMYIAQMTDQIALKYDTQYEQAVNLQDKISQLAAQQKKYEEEKNEVHQKLEALKSQKQSDEQTYQKLAQQVQIVKEEHSRVNEQKKTLEEEINRLQLLQAKQKKLKQELNSIEKEIAQQRQKNERNNQELEKELREIRMLVEQKNVKRAELENLERETQAHAESARRYAEEILKRMPKK